MKFEVNSAIKVDILARSSIQGGIERVDVLANSAEPAILRSKFNAKGQLGSGHVDMSEGGNEGLNLWHLFGDRGNPASAARAKGTGVPTTAHALGQTLLVDGALSAVGGGGGSSLGEQLERMMGCCRAFRYKFQVRAASGKRPRPLR